MPVDLPHLFFQTLQFLFEQATHSMFGQIDLRHAHTECPGDLARRPLAQDVKVINLTIPEVGPIFDALHGGLDQRLLPVLLPDSFERAERRVSDPFHRRRALGIIAKRIGPLA